MVENDSAGTENFTHVLTTKWPIMSRNDGASAIIAVIKIEHCHIMVSVGVHKIQAYGNPESDSLHTKCVHIAFNICILCMYHSILVVIVIFL